MSCVWNGKALPGGARHCLGVPAGPMRQTPARPTTSALSREQMIRLGCVFPPKSPKLPDRPKKEIRGERQRPITSEDVARILSGYEAGKSVTAIAISVKRAASAVSRVLIGNGKDPSRFGKCSPVRIRAVELLRSGKSPEEIAPKIGAALSYVRNIASNVRRAESAERREAA